MSSTERAPEPTMEEILASIRRIISDDEANLSRQRPAAAKPKDDEGLEAGEIEADDKIINDIARVLSESQPQVEDEEDILDLTAELSGVEIIEEVIVEVEEVAAPIEMPPPPPIAPRQAAFEVPQAPQSEASAPVAPPPLSASEEAASALERAIAALRAGQLPTSVSEFMPKTEPAPEPQSFAPAPEPAAAAPEPEPEPEPEPVAEPEPWPALEPEVPELEPEPEMALSEFAAETVVEEIVLPDTPVESAPEESVAPPEESLPWRVAPPPLFEPERPAARKNGGSHGASPLEASHKTLEDSVKDMLRPMLKQWLDENMPRVLTAALKDELGERRVRGQGE